MNPSKLLLSIFVAVVSLAHVEHVSAQLRLKGRKPKSGVEYKLNKKINIRGRVAGNRKNDPDLSVQFQLQNPSGGIADWVDAQKKGKTVRYRRKLKAAGTWKWRVKLEVPGFNTTLPWFDIEIAGAPTAPTTPTAPVPVPTAPVPVPTAPVPVPTAPVPVPTAPVPVPTAPVPVPTAPVPVPTPTSDPPPIQAATDDIAALFDSDRDLRAKFVRLGFHMCVGGCDGCIDLDTNLDNKGLDVPIESLTPIVTKYAGTGLTRSDIWALAALVASYEAQPRNNRIDFPFEWYGRPDGDCTDGTTGPTQVFPGPDLNTHELLEFFATNFGLTTRETVALMGAHTIGELAQDNSGFRGPNGWVNNNRILNAAYYDGLIGGDENTNELEDVDEETLINARNWRQRTVDNSGNANFPNKRQWENGGNGNTIVMLNTDIALVRDFSNHFDADTKAVSCDFRGRSRCPVADATFRTMAEFKYDNDMWVREFKDVFTKLLLDGHTTGTCASPPCQISS